MGGYSKCHQSNTFVFFVHKIRPPSANHSATGRHPHCLPSALNSANRDSSMIPLNVNTCSLKSVTMTNYNQDKTLMTTMSSWDSLRPFLTVCAVILYSCKLIVAAAVRVVLGDIGGKAAGCGGPGPVLLHVVYGFEASWMHWQISWNASEDSLW